MRLAPLAVASLLVSCGGSESRALQIEVRGLSARADLLVVQLFPESTGQTCSGVTLETAAGFEAPIELSWERQSGAPRTLSYDKPVEGEQLTVIAYATTGAGQTIQFLCTTVDYDAITGLLAIRLSDRPTSSP
ncbi:MAG: hypothetical protein HYV07_32635 [Deltaproteobacteria bacterium]|nr:hypothetical protein [Deltaproteobacteria bacterium]